MQEGMDSTACMHLSGEIWAEACRFFHHDPNLRHPDYIVKIPQFGRKLLPVQAHSVWHCFKIFNGVEQSLFLGHVMGIGKTTIAYAIYHIQHIINRMHDDIRQAPGKHVPEGSLDQEAQCPSNEEARKRWGFDCPCAPCSPTYFIKQKLGVTVALVPLGLLDVWTFEFGQCFPQTKTGRPFSTLLRAHRSTSIPDSVRDLLLGQEEEYFKTDENGKQLPAPSVFTPKLSNSRVFVISTSQSFESRFLNVFQEQKSWMFQPPGKDTKRSDGSWYVSKPKLVKRQTPTFPTSIISILFRDEFHLEKGDNSSAIKIIRIVKRRQKSLPISVVPMSGTPLTTGPRDIAYYLELMRHSGWAQDSVLKDWTENLVFELAQRWEKDCTQQPNPKMASQIIQRFQPLVERLFLRFTTTSDFLGHRPMKVPPNIFEEIKCDNGPFWEERIESLRADEEARLLAKEQKRRQTYHRLHKGNMTKYEALKRNIPNAYYRARLCASFPALMDIREDGEPLKLTESEWEVHIVKHPEVGIKRWIAGTDSDPYFKNLDMIVKSSSKLTKIAEKLEEFKNFIDSEGKKVR